MTTLQEKIDDIMRLYLTNEPTQDIFPLVDQVFDNIEDVGQMCQLLEFLPPSLSNKNFIKVLKSEKTQRSAQIAKANLSVVESMKLDPIQMRPLYLLMHECLNVEPSFSNDSHQMLVRYLATFNKVDENTVEVEEKACQAIINTLILPIIWRFDEVSDLVPVRGLAASKKEDNRKLYALFDIFCYKGYNEYQDFHRENSERIEKWGLSHQALMEKIRLLWLCRMAQESKTQNNDNILTYSDIAIALGIHEEEVESIVIRAVGLKLLGARVDQVKKTIKIWYTHHAMFTHDQWRQLQETLGAWKDNISELVQRFEEIKSTSNRS